MRIYLAAALALLAFADFAARMVIPLALSLNSGNPWWADIRWNFWWAVNLALAAKFIRPGTGTWFFGVLASWLQLGIVSVKTALFFLDPSWALWPSLRFALGCVSLMVFSAMVIYLHGTSEGRELGETD